MKRTIYLLIATAVLASCGGGKKADKTEAELAKLKKERSALDEKIKALESKTADTSRKATPVSITTVEPTDFRSYINVQSSISGDENVTATPQAPGIIKNILVRVGQKVSKGQTLATLDAAVAEQNIKALEPTLILQKSLYEKQKKLWAQNIGTEVQLLGAKAQYEALQKQKAALIAQRDMYTIKSPISGTVDLINVKEGDATSPGGQNGIRVVSYDKLKAEANLGENYLGKVHQGDRVDLVLPDMNDSIQTSLTYVSKAVDPISRAFTVQVRLGNNPKLHPNMSCIMKIANYEHTNTIVIPVAVIQKTANGNMVYVVEGNKAKAVPIQVGQNSNGLVEVLGGLKAGDKVVTEGFEDLDDGAPITIM
ncbi:MAG: efflux RND transporter periplasmic adaptor subunit [Flavipsychrobacter sp.]